jgi:nitrate reductase molybdenum cofactor assembly chaperone NarJ/NarW
MGICEAFAALLDYPDDTMLDRVDLCRDLLEASSALRPPTPDVVEALQQFREDAARIGTGRLQESYTSAFDLDGACALDVGHHLFGQDLRRSLFLSRLAGIYREAGFTAPPGEAPDHLSTMLRFVDSAGGADECSDLLADAILPATSLIASGLERRPDAQPYARLVRALVSVLGRMTVARASDEGAVL